MVPKTLFSWALSGLSGNLPKATIKTINGGCLTSVQGAPGGYGRDNIFGGYG
jgi:hypothetical protein